MIENIKHHKNYYEQEYSKLKREFEFGTPTKDMEIQITKLSGAIEALSNILDCYSIE